MNEQGAKVTFVYTKMLITSYNFLKLYPQTPFNEDTCTPFTAIQSRPHYNESFKKKKETCCD